MESAIAKANVIAMSNNIANLKFSSFELELKEYAKENNVPIIFDEGLAFLEMIIRLYNPKRILEIGAAIGYSSIKMALVDEEIEITTIERDEKRYLEAVKNIKKFHLEDRINLIYKEE